MKKNSNNTTYNAFVARIVAGITIVGEARGVTIRAIADTHAFIGWAVPSRVINGMLQDDCVALGISRKTMENYCSAANNVMADDSKEAKEFLAGTRTYYDYAIKNNAPAVKPTAKGKGKGKPAARKAATLADVKASAKTLNKKDRLALITFLAGL